MGTRDGSPICLSTAALREARLVKSSFKAAILFVLIAVTGYLAFYYAPIERSMGVIQKIFYLHISCAFSAFVAFGTCFYANLRYVFTREAKSDWLGVSAAEVGLAFITVVLILLVSARYRLEALRASVEDLRREAEVR